MEQTMEALLALQGPSMPIERDSHNSVRVEVMSVASTHGRVLLPMNLNLEVEIAVTLDEATRTYTFTGRSFEMSGFSVHTERFRGVYRRREWGKYLTLDGTVPVSFDTGVVFDELERVLTAHGWSRARRRWPFWRRRR